MWTDQYLGPTCHWTITESLALADQVGPTSHPHSDLDIKRTRSNPHTKWLESSSPSSSPSQCTRRRRRCRREGRNPSRAVGVTRKRRGEMFRYQKGGDVEAGTSGAPGGAAGARELYPGMTEPPEMRWALIRKIYIILSMQLLLTAAVAAVVVKVRAISHFFVSSHAGLGLYIFLIILPFIVLCPLYYYHQKHPVNLILLGLFTVAISFAVGMTCAFTSGKVILESAILTTVVVVSLTAYTFWAAKRGRDFSFLGPFLFASLIVLLVFAFIQILFPLGKISQMIYGGIASLIFSGYIVYDTDNIIKRYTYDQYVWAAVSLYLDVINLFLSLMTLFRAAD
ncbi:hypothetical protein E2562_035817 [Oryza meyeriana var. granulata]|uniref:BI1-like protein n=1 Tax=Oryza meyeriana var. granulata TaxID=110450 RepID=A0A6G1DAD5_9ORYZ|nr:hypothetical protein E2562_035817 [Oryza meyeriana var. granulata]